MRFFIIVFINSLYNMIAIKEIIKQNKIRNKEVIQEIVNS